MHVRGCRSLQKRAKEAQAIQCNLIQRNFLRCPSRIYQSCLIQSRIYRKRRRKSTALFCCCQLTAACRPVNRRGTARRRTVIPPPRTKALGPDLALLGPPLLGWPFVCLSCEDACEDPCETGEEAPSAPFLPWRELLA